MTTGCQQGRSGSSNRNERTTTMQSFSTVRRVLAALAVTLVAGTMFSQSAQAAAPTKIRDKTFSIGCQVEDGGTRTQFAVGRSELAGTDAHFQVHTDGFFQLGGE